jgi:hypothetical protein
MLNILETASWPVIGGADRRLDYGSQWIVGYGKGIIHHR